MKSLAVFLVRYGKADIAFETREISVRDPGEGEIRIKASAFGLNYADVMARLGLYREAPPIPSVIGYEVHGKVDATGPGVPQAMLGSSVVSFCRFGGYSRHLVVPASAATDVPEEWPAGKGLALVTQYSTAWYASMIAATLRENEWVLINSAAGGVGTALLQLAKWKKCRIIGSSGSGEKLEHILNNGAEHALNYKQDDFSERLKSISESGLDLVFDAVGGTVFKKSFKALAPTGRIVCYGAASRSQLHFLPMIRLAFQFGFTHPALLMMQSRAMIGINMLRVAEHQPHLLRESLLKVKELAVAGILEPLVGKVFPVAELAGAHEFLGSGKSTGKLVIQW